MNKTIFITGASTGIGKATAIYFAEQGWNVAATMRTTAKGADLLKYTNVKVWPLDVMQTESISTAIDQTIAHFGGIDVIFNNAGYALVGAFEAMSDAQLRQQFDTNVFGVMNVTRAILPYFREKKGGTIINTTSMGGIITFPLYSVYHSTKWALEGFMESLQFELRAHHIKIKNIEPGAIKTDFDTAIDFVSSAAYDPYATNTHHSMLENYKQAPGPIVVAKKVWQAANDSSYRLRYPVGGLGPLLIIMRKVLPFSWFTALVRLATEKGNGVVNN
ncbi:MAG: SDR family oxidoreductase [bacterium]|nr:SDR family oxidoreductase [bacterium]